VGGLLFRKAAGKVCWQDADTDVSSTLQTGEELTEGQYALAQYKP
jgi:hypothetical protein